MSFFVIVGITGMVLSLVAFQFLTSYTKNIESQIRFELQQDYRRRVDRQKSRVTLYQSVPTNPPSGDVENMTISLLDDDEDTFMHVLVDKMDDDNEVVSPEELRAEGASKILKKTEILYEGGCIDNGCDHIVEYLEYYHDCRTRYGIDHNDLLQSFRTTVKSPFSRWRFMRQFLKCSKKSSFEMERYFGPIDEEGMAAL